MATITKSSALQSPRVMTVAAIRREIRKRSGGVNGGKRPGPRKNAVKEPALAVRETDQTDEESFNEEEPVRTGGEIIKDVDNGLDAIQELLVELKMVRDLKKRKRKAHREKGRLR